MSEHWADENNESGLRNYEATRFEEWQEILRADPAHEDWLASIDTQRTEDNDEIRSESIH